MPSNHFVFSDENMESTKENLKKCLIRCTDYGDAGVIAPGNWYDIKDQLPLSRSGGYQLSWWLVEFHRFDVDGKSYVRVANVPKGVCNFGKDSHFVKRIDDSDLQKAVREKYGALAQPEPEEYLVAYDVNPNGPRLPPAFFARIGDAGKAFMDEYNHAYDKAQADAKSASNAGSSSEDPCVIDSDEDQQKPAKKAKKANDASKEEAECVVCLCAKATHMLSPCAHKVLCKGCADLAAIKNKCPICQTYCEGFVDCS